MRDYTIRQLLRETELSPYLTDNISKVVEELKLPIAGARIDVAVINGSLHGFEIKSAVDTLQRLPYQIEAYSKVFDYLYIVTEGRHYQKVLDILPKWVGLIVCSDNAGICSVRTIRASKKNKLQDGFFLAKLLWKEELISIFREHKIPYKKNSGTWILCEILAEKMEVKNLSAIVRNKLKNRPTDWKNISQQAVK